MEQNACCGVVHSHVLNKKINTHTCLRPIIMGACFSPQRILLARESGGQKIVFYHIFREGIAKVPHPHGREGGGGRAKGSPAFLSILSCVLYLENSLVQL